MASRTQLRLGQITGSFGDVEGGIVDNLPFDSAATLAGLTLTSGSMVGVMSEIASSLLRIHGGGGNTFLGNDVSTLTDIDGTSRITYAASSKTLIAGLGGGTDAVDINATGGVDIDATGGFTVDAVGASNVTTNGALTLSGSTGLNLKADSGTLDIETRLGAIDLDAGGALSLDSATSVSLGTANSGIAITIGHSTSEVTVADNLTVTGDLTVNGGVTAVATTNLEVQDRLIGLNYASGSSEAALADAGFVIGNSGGNQKAFFWDNDQTQFALVDTANNAGDSAITPADYVDLRLGALIADDSVTVTGLTTNQIVFPDGDGLLGGSANLTFDGSDLQLANDIGLVFSTDDAEKIESDGTNLTVTSGGDIILDAVDDIILDADGDDIHLKYGANTVGFLSNSSNKLILSGGHAGESLALAANSGIVQFIDPADGTSVGAIIESNLIQSALTLSASSGNNLILGSNDTYIQFDVAEAEIFRIQSGGGEAILSSSADRQISLYPNDGKVTIYQNNTSGGPGLGLFIDAGKDASALSSAFVGIDGFKNLEIDGSPGTEKLIVSGTYVELKGGQSPQELRFAENTPNGSNYVALEAPDSIASNFTISLPNAIGTAGQILKIASVGSGDAQLEFGSAVGDLARFGFKITQTVAAGQVNFGSSKTTGVSALTSYTNNLNITKAESVLDDTLEVFVNGQLLVSGASGDADRDYTFVDSDSINFAFSLESDDIVQIIQR